MRRFVFAGVVLAIGMASVNAPLAEDATERAGELKAWREQCADPDSDLRTAYIEAAIATDDVAIIRICVRQSLESDDADIRNLGLRAALASAGQLQFEVTTPNELANLLKKYGDDGEKIQRAIDDGTLSGRLFQLDNSLKPGIAFSIESDDISRGVSTWYPLLSLPEKSDGYKGKAVVVGDKVNWTGAAINGNNVLDCRLNLTLAPGAMLTGSFQCEQMAAFPVSAKLL